MSILDSGKMCTFSQVSGVLLKEGKPIANARVIREADYESKSVDETTTDDNGRFQMPAQYVRSIAKFLPQEFVVTQQMFIDLNGERIRFWAGAKRGVEENTESQGKPLDLVCEITDEETVKSFDGQSFITRCQWDVVEDEPLSDDDFFETE